MMCKQHHACEYGRACADCVNATGRKAYQAEYYRANREKRKQAVLERYYANRDAINARRREMRIKSNDRTTKHIR